MKNIVKCFLAFAAAASVATGCTKGFEQLNQNIFGVSEEDLSKDGLAVGSMLQQLERSVIIYRDGTYLDSDYQIMYNLCAETWCGYMAPTLS
ncbi:MAG: SusD/RagB family nutrient-binding outer membrane lipoprotein, partial [Bacteroidales bacterium]|nr:SusD/RagB family nutrient-binding outer membrane lipoprotein [Bacteroidales bacterium]